MPLGGYGLQAVKFTISHQLGEISTRRVCFPTPGRCPGCCPKCSWLMESQRETRCVSISPISSSASPNGDPVPTPLPSPSLCFCYPALCVSPVVLGNILSPGVKETPGILAGGLLWECTGPLHGADLGLLAAAPNLLFVHFSHDQLRQVCFQGGLERDFPRSCLEGDYQALSQLRLGLPTQMFCDGLSNFGLIASLKAHGLDFPANRPGVMQKSGWFSTTVQLNPLQGPIDSKEVSWKSTLFSQVALSHGHNLQLSLLLVPKAKQCCSRRGYQGSQKAGM